jgi:hypothetical protein
MGGGQRDARASVLADLGPLPEVTESDTDTSWRMFLELQEQHTTGFLKTEPSALTPLDDGATDKAPNPTAQDVLLEARRLNRVCPSEAQGTTSMPCSPPPELARRLPWLARSSGPHHRWSSVSVCASRSNGPQITACFRKCSGSFAGSLRTSGSIWSFEPGSLRPRNLLPAGEADEISPHVRCPSSTSIRGWAKRGNFHQRVGGAA